METGLGCGRIARSRSKKLACEKHKRELIMSLHNKAQHEQIDLGRFELEVGVVADEIGAAWSGDEHWIPARVGAVSVNERNRAIEELVNRIYQDTTAHSGTSLGSNAQFRNRKRLW